MRSHPPTLITLVRRALDRSRLVDPGGHVLVALSGGPDSMALLHVLARLRAKYRFTITAHGVDHGLRTTAGPELDQAEAFAKTLDVPFERTCVTVAPGGNLQARARKARHEALHAAAVRAGANRIAFGHHADDRAETVLIRLLRGAGPRGLAVLPPRAGMLIRPFIQARRSDVQAHLMRHSIPSATDPSNTNPRYLRTRVRLELIPFMTQLNPAIVEHLCALADQLGEVCEHLPEPLPLFEIAQITPLPRVTQAALKSLSKTQSPEMRIALPGGVVASYDREHLRLTLSGRTRRRQGLPEP